MKNLITILCFSLNFILGCIDGIEVELWGECYNIEETTILNLNNNGLIGEIPTEIGQLMNLTELYLYNNQLIGYIPDVIWELTNLEKLILFNNQLSGEISSNIGTSSNLLFLDLYNNNISGEIPIEIGNLINLEHLNLYGNELSGLVPIEICNQGSSPSLSNNKLCPPYPECLSEANIGNQDISECEEECPDSIQGDLNDDGVLNILDVISIKNCILGSNCDTCSDINEDGSTDVLDIVEMVNYILDI